MTPQSGNIFSVTQLSVEFAIPDNIRISQVSYLGLSGYEIICLLSAACGVYMNQLLNAENLGT